MLFSPHLQYFLDITIGFDSRSYSVWECDGHVSIRVKVSDSQLERAVVVSLSTSDISAFGKNFTFY